ncbi:hypothetical protein V6N11_057853 [Hibiscus sabdariffa]|uniref:Rx N-terminal domain-containing protein n=1 Tax=Hibiscus sabdariffa TaxID=183260 RepID=A0ABR2P3R8_9ROSI
MEVLVASLGDTVVSALFRSLVDFISSTHFLKFAHKDKISSELEKWKRLLLNINASLEDAEEKQITSRSVKLWLSELRDIAYDADDIIDELATEARRRQMMEEQDPSSPTSKVKRYISSCCLSCNPSKTVQFSIRMESRLKGLTVRLEEAVARKSYLSLVENDRGRDERMRERLRTSSLVDESHVYGRERDKEAVLDLLMNDCDDGVADIGVVSIVGEAGSRILVTTRNEGVASIMATCGTYHLKELTNDDCLSLFARHALGTSDFEGHLNLKVVGKMKNLQVLSKFIVQKDGGPNIGELKGLLYLRKELSIRGLENAVDTRDTRECILKDKQGLESLELQWSDVGNGEKVMPVFSMLQPHENLKKIRITFYGGTKFPSWFSGPSLANIVDMNLSNCRNIKSLPALGRLPSLKMLSIEGMNGVKKLDFEFYGGSIPTFKPFPVLEVLQFQNMLEWEYWYYPNEADKVDGAFSSLCEVMICNCPKLQHLPRFLPSLLKLAVKGCPNMADSVMSFPSLQELNIENCNKMVPMRMVDLTSLTTLRVRNLPDLTCLPDGFEQLSGALQHLFISNCTGLTSLWQKVTECEDVVSVEPVKINGSSPSSSPAGNEKIQVHNKTRFPVSLEQLHIESCPKLVSFSETSFLSRLRHLKLRDCLVLKKLPIWVMSRCLLEDFEIEECPLLEHFPRESLPPKLKRLKIQGCINLCSLSEGLMQADNNKYTSYLEKLEIIGCPSLDNFPEGKLPTTLKVLKIWDCLKLEPLSDRIFPNNSSLEYIDIWKVSTLVCFPESLYKLMSLVELNINDCQHLKFFPEIGLPLPNLSTLNICNCVELKSLSDQMSNLTSLKHLTICDCPSLSFPRGGLPPNLLSLEIWYCKELTKPDSEWNLHTLISLQDLSIAGGPEIVSFPDEKFLLPTTLVSIYIAKLQNLESLTKGLQNLPSLEELEVADCPKLRRLPGEGLPATLGRLCIRNCPLLENLCSRNKGKYWPLIAHIPCVEIEATDI